MQNNLRCEVCNVDAHRASMQKHLKSEKLLENEKRNEVIIPEWFFEEQQAPIKNTFVKVYNPKTLKHIARINIRMKDKELDKELSKK